MTLPASFPVSFLWPEALWGLLVLPLLVWAYVAILRRRRAAALRFASLSVVQAALGSGRQRRRHVPPLLLLAAIAALVVASARPQAVIKLPSLQETIVLAMDVSGSMRATDVEPNRLVAAQNAAKAFIADQPRKVRIGIVSFAGTASVVQPPTENREDLTAAIDRFQLQRGTAIGSGIIVSLATIFPDAGIDVSALIYGKEAPRGVPLGDPAKKAAKPHVPVPPGSHGSAAIILLTDGQRTTGPDSLEAAKMAAERGIRVYTVGIGTVGGETIGFEGWSMRVRLDEDSLKKIATLTQGEYFYAGSAAELKRIYQKLNSRFVLEEKHTEVSAVFAALGALFALLSAGLSLLWFNRVL